MSSRIVPSLPDIVFGIVALVLFALAGRALTHSDGDLFAHIVLGTQILEQVQLPHVSMFGLTTSGSPMVGHAWLSEVLFAFVFRTGGLPAVVALTALVLASAHAIGALMLRRHEVDARWILVTILWSLALGATHWLARPHAFSILGASALIAILERNGKQTILWTIVIMALWTNLHGGWIFGIILIGLYSIGDTIEWLLERADLERRSTMIRRWSTLVCSFLITLCNPYGLALHRDILHTLGDSTVTTVIDEYQASTFRSPEDLAFLLVLLITIVLLARGRHVMPFAHLGILAATIAFALHSGRNIALFGVTGWPLVALYGYGAVQAWLVRSPMLATLARLDREASVGRWAGGVTLAICMLGATGGHVGRWAMIAYPVDHARFPVHAIARLQERFGNSEKGSGHLAQHRAPAEVRIFTPWDWGGYLVFAWPGQAAFIDPLKFTAQAVTAYGEILLLRPRWREQLEQWRINTVVIPPHSLLAATLAEDTSWKTWYRDSSSVVLLRVR